MLLKITTGPYAGEYVMPGTSGEAPITLGERVAFARLSGGIEWDEHRERWSTQAPTAAGLLAHVLVTIKRRHPKVRAVELEDLDDDAWDIDHGADDEADGEAGPDPTGAPAVDDHEGPKHEHEVSTSERETTPSSRSRGRSGGPRARSTS